MIAYVFPGQGSQHIGMGAALADASGRARDVFAEVDEALGQHLFRLMRDGPEAELTRTENAQPAIMAVSVAVARVLERDCGVALAGRAAFVAGHSLGEYSALCAAGALGLAQTARLLRLRGEAMQAAVPEGEGGMAALLGAGRSAADALAAAAAPDPSRELCVVANDNAPGQLVLSGHAGAIGRAVAMAGAHGIKKAVRLAVSAPFHSPLMAPAAAEMADVMARQAMLAPLVPLVSNVSAASEGEVGRLRALLVEGITGAVRWRECVDAMAGAGVDRFVELGGRVLTPLGRRCAPGAEHLALVAMADLEAFAR